jgi:hypothetical protein
MTPIDVGAADGEASSALLHPESSAAETAAASTAVSRGMVEGITESLHQATGSVRNRFGCTRTAIRWGVANVLYSDTPIDTEVSPCARPV